MQSPTEPIGLPQNVRPETLPSANEMVKRHRPSCFGVKSKLSKVNKKQEKENYSKISFIIAKKFLFEIRPYVTSQIFRIF
jgi:hypothetical protein